MTANRRIALNFIATYGRSVFALMCGLFSGRWVLASLGQVDYGLWGVVGGLTAFIVFLNTLMAGAISRFYAVSVGKANVQSGAGIEECRRWFNTAITIHTVLPTILVVIGYPLGVWAVNSFLTIPIDRVPACVWVWRSVCLSCYVAMVNVPFQAMYVAKQEIAELTIYSIMQTLVNIIVAYIMVTHPGDWLATYAWISCVSAVVPQLIIMMRAARVFPECKINRKYFFLRANLKELGRYAMYRFWGMFAGLLQSQGNAILVNKFVGPSGNATMSLGSTVASHTVTLSNAMSTAIGPAIYNAYGAGEIDRLRRLAVQASKMGALLYLFIVIPAGLEVHYLMKLWLVNPPELAAEFCLFIMAAYLTERISDGQVNVIYATGRIERFQLTLCMLCVLGFVLACVFIGLGMGVVGAGLAIVLYKTLIMFARSHYAKKLIGLSFMEWLLRCVLPSLVLIILCFLINGIIRLLMSESFFRLVVSTVVVEFAFMTFSWYLICNQQDREYIKVKIIDRIFRRGK